MILKKYIPAMLLAFMLAIGLFASNAQASGGGRTITLTDSKALWMELANAQDGDTFVLSGLCAAVDPSGKDAPLVINKAVTIQGGSLTFHTGGIILNADVTFRDITLGFPSPVRNAIMANGHTLTLENVQAASTGYGFHLFCGGLYDPNGFGSTPGPAGKIVLGSSVSLKGRIDGTGSLYAGNLCMGGMNPEQDAIDGPANAFAGDAEIVFEGDKGEFGGIYAGGAQQRIPQGSPNGKVILPDPENYTVDGRVTVRLMNGQVGWVQGRGASETHVVYNGNGDLTDGIVMNDIASLRVESGYLIPELGSTFGEVVAASGAKLGLMNLGDLTVGSFSGGGTLQMREEQTLTVSGAVTGSTAIEVVRDAGGVWVKSLPKEEHAYVQALESAEGAFTLSPPQGYETVNLVRDESGGWKVPAGSIPMVVLVDSFAVASPVMWVKSGTTSAAFTLEAEYAENSAPGSCMDYVPVEITVNNKPAEYTYVEGDGEWYYMGEQVAVRIADNCLEITASSKPYWDPIPSGTYDIEITVHGSNTWSGQELRGRAVLTVGSGGTQQEEFPYAIESLAVNDAAVTVGVSQLDGAAGGVVYAASYGADGRLLGVAAVPVPVSVQEEEPELVTVPLNSSGAGHVAVFITGGETMRPLCGNQRVNIVDVLDNR